MLVNLLFKLKRTLKTDKNSIKTDKQQAVDIQEPSQYLWTGRGTLQPLHFTTFLFFVTLFIS